MSNDPDAHSASFRGGNLGEQVHHMVCVHGSTGFLQSSDTVIVSRDHTGLKIEGGNGARAVVGVPIPTTLLCRGSRLVIRSVVLDFSADPGVALTSLSVFSGSRLISRHARLNHSGRNRYRQFDIQGEPRLGTPISLSATIHFGAGLGRFSLGSASAVFVERPKGGEDEE